jgi:hypothetical protein
MRSLSIAVVLIAVGVGAARVAAEPFAISYHRASGSGTAQVFDGGPPVHADEHSSNPLESV